MIALVIAMSGLAIWATLATATAVASDGYRQIPTDWSRVPPQD